MKTEVNIYEQVWIWRQRLNLKKSAYNCHGDLYVQQTFSQTLTPPFVTRRRECWIFGQLRCVWTLLVKMLAAFVSFFNKYQTCRELQQLTTISKKSSSMLVVRLLVLDPICLLLGTQSSTTSVNPTHVLGPNDPCTRSRSNKINSYTHSLCTSRLRYAEVLGRVLTSGLWFKTTQHLLCRYVFPDHVFRGCEFSFLFFKCCTQY